jgi:hypothetical protein
LATWGLESGFSSSFALCFITTSSLEIEEEEEEEEEDIGYGGSSSRGG